MIQIRSANEREALPEGISDCPFAKRQLKGVTPPFDAEQQYVSNQGAHAFVAPSGNDQRPGLNAMANHGYLPHNGVGTITDFISGCQEAFGMGIDLASFLAIYGAIFDGDFISYSIGGPYPSLLNLGGLLGAAQGLSRSHNKYEGDGSPTRGDLYQYGNDYLVQLSQFTALYEMGQENGNSVDLTVLTKYRAQRFEESMANNPYFFYAPFSGVVVTPAAYSFIYRFMANKSAEHPTGLLDGETLKSFFSITGDYPNFKYTPGHEKFPDNWYKRNLVDYYTIPYLAEDAVTMALEHPEFLSIGGNTGKTNSFVGVDLEDLTSGVFNAGNLLKGNNAICFGLEASLQEAPDILSGLFSDISSALAKLSSAVNAATDGLGCPVLDSIDKGQFSQYPGYTKLKPDGSYS
ncbi:Cloroperoxidase [Rhizodiscina lignyota]|uniref:Cloroperoxidase n=1 Tax=Rhizodiscina lignyota TaxID=1504668 RepID=A0A9P4M7V8_9PEZI|nr:Cloroperoxidase [Rhizodiscina lignyota]